MSEPLVRLTRPSDAGSLSDLDLKTYQYPLALEEWKEMAGLSGKPTEPKVVVVEVARKPIAFALWQDAGEDVVRIIRLGVLRDYRRKGIGGLLISQIIKHSQVSLHDKLRIVIPDIHCLPNDPDDVSDFLKSTEFEANGEIITEYCKMYGDMRDGYVFERGIVYDKTGM